MSPQIVMAGLDPATSSSAVTADHWVQPGNDDFLGVMTPYTPQSCVHSD
jgi:hypothetical protein